MDWICTSLANVFVYLDDILIASMDNEQHVKDLTELFKRLESNGLVVNRRKCVFGVKSIEFLGHQVSASGIAPLEAKVGAVRNFPQPTTVKQLQRFLGMLNFYHRFVPHVAEILVPLHEALTGRKRFTALQWTPGMESAFIEAKNALADATLFRHPCENASTALTVDASQ